MFQFSFEDEELSCVVCMDELRKQDSFILIDLYFVFSGKGIYLIVMIGMGPFFFGTFNAKDKGAQQTKQEREKKKKIIFGRF